MGFGIRLLLRALTPVSAFLHGRVGAPGVSPAIRRLAGIRASFPLADHTLGTGRLADSNMDNPLGQSSIDVQTRQHCLIEVDSNFDDLAQSRTSLSKLDLGDAYHLPMIYHQFAQEPEYRFGGT